MGIAHVLRGLCGPDLVDHVKNGPAFYEKIFAQAGVPPGSALVIESDEECCRWASEAGANTAWIDPDGHGDATSLALLAETLLADATAQ